jgi:hypothetical protein
LAKGRDFFVTSIEVRNKQTITLPTTTGSTWTELAIRCCVVLWLFGIGPERIDPPKGTLLQLGCNSNLKAFDPMF